MEEARVAYELKKLDALMASRAGPKHVYDWNKDGADDDVENAPGEISDEDHIDSCRSMYERNPTGFLDFDGEEIVDQVGGGWSKRGLQSMTGDEWEGVPRLRVYHTANFVESELWEP